MDIFLNISTITLTLLISALTLTKAKDFERLDFSKGIKLGFCYFISAPLILLLLSGEIRAYDLFIPPLNLSSNPKVFIIILLSSASVLLLRSGDKIKHHKNIDLTSKRKIIVITVVYFLISLYLFIGSGKLSGGHWHTSVGEQLSGNSTATLLAVIKNSLRFAVPGYILFAFRQKKIEHSLFAALLIAISANEIITSSNRITALICITCYIIGIGLKDKKKIFALILSAPFVLYANSIFPAIRGAIWSNGLDLNHITSLIKSPAERRTFNSSLDILYDATEATNLTMISLVIDNYPDKQSYLLGETVLLRPLLFYIPKSIWKERPETFSITVGKLSGSMIDGLALNSTIIGELYANFGLLSPLALLLITSAIAIASKRFRRRDSLYALFFCAIGAWRFDFVFLLISLILILIIELCCRASIHSLDSK